MARKKGRFRKGSPEAKRFMSKLRSMKKNSKRKVNKARSPVIAMAKRRSSRAKASFRRYASRKAFLPGDIKGLAIGAGLYTAYAIWLKPTIQNSVPAINQAMPVVETVGGYLLAKMKQPLLRDTGKVMFTFGIFQLINQYVVPGIAGGQSMTQSQTVYN